ncbi:MAG: DUF2510 domain-containing protein [Microcella sp.]
MSTTSTVAAPAGWYADPVQAASGSAITLCRWWDGQQWTSHVATVSTPTSPMVSSAAVSSAASLDTATGSITIGAPATPTPRESARAAESMPLHAVDPAAGLRAAHRRPTRSTASPLSPSALSPANAETGEYVPFAARNRAASIDAPAVDARNPLRLRVHTVSVWLIASMPVTQALLVFWVFSTLPAETSAWTRALAVVFPLILSAALATQDRRLMEASGHLRTAPWVAALLAPPVYLAVRGVRVARATGARSWPLVVWLGAQLSVLTVWFVLDPAAVIELARTVLG